MDMKQMQEMMARAQQMQQQLQQQMRELQVEASAGGSAVLIRMNGEKHVVSVRIEKEAASDIEMLQDLVTAAVNEAARKVDAEIQSKLGGMMGGLMGGMGLPPGMF
jgi:DNA-binding YbaB/EbfC family protein